MKRIVKILKSIYDFFAGDLILLSAVAIAFGATALLALGRHEENLLLVVTLIGVIVIGVVTTIGRELGTTLPHVRKEIVNEDKPDGELGG